MAAIETVGRTAARVKRSIPEINGMTIVTVVVVLALVYLIVVPLGMQVITAFRGPHLPFAATAQTSVENFVTIYSTGAFTSTLRDTALFVGGGVLLSFLLGFTFAWLIERTDIPARNFFFLLLLIPAIMPGIVAAQAWILMLGPQSGIMNQTIRFFLPFWETGPISPFTFPAMILVQGLSGVTFFFLLLSAVLRSMDGGLEEASRASGGGTFQTLRRVTLPILAPGMLAVALLSVIISVGQFEVPLLFGVSAGANIFSLRLWEALNPAGSGLPRYGEAAAFGVAFLVITYGLFYFYVRLTRQANKFATVTGKGFRPRRMELGKWKYPAIVFIFFYLAIAFIVPFLTLLWASLIPFFQPFSIERMTERASLDAYRLIFIDRQFWGGLWRSFVVAGLSATIAVSLGMVAAWVVARGRPGPLTRGLDLLATSSVAIPASVAAIAFFIFYLQVGRAIPLFGTIWILVLAYAFRTAVAYRQSYAGILQINRELEEASLASGASRLSTFKRVIVPLILPHAMMAWLLVFVLGIHEFTIAIFLSTGRSATLPVVLFNRISGGGGAPATDEAAAMAVVFTVIGACAVLVLRLLVTRWGIRQQRAN